MRVVHHAHEWAAHRKDGARVALVPTMGNLHAGHIALVEHAAGMAEQVVVSIFVNPLQFSEGEDFARYPRTLKADIAALASLDSAEQIIIFAPDASAFIRDISAPAVPHSLIHTLCGLSRPRLFPGVMKVVTLLLEAVGPNIAVFGEKDWQQLQVVRAMAEHLDVHIHSVPILREPDGLALSSRNQYLSTSARERASEIYQTLRTIQQTAQNTTQQHVKGGIAKAVQNAIRNAIKDAKTTLKNLDIHVEYLFVLDERTLLPPSLNGHHVRIFIAAWLGNVRLIDNAPVYVESSSAARITNSINI